MLLKKTLNKKKNCINYYTESPIGHQNSIYIQSMEIVIQILFINL